MSEKLKYDREQALKERLNSFLVKQFALPEKDYYSALDAKGFVGLKSVLSDINNILTLRVTFAFIEWVSVGLDLDSNAKKELEKIVLESKPNSNGYDAWLGYPVSFVAEVKCNIPINRGSIYGSAQRQGIENDVTGLMNGKRKASMLPHSCLKFFVFLDIPEIRKANEHLLTVSEIFKKNMLFDYENTKLSRTDIIHGLYVSPKSGPTGRVEDTLRHR